ncbi:MULTISPECIES: helix-turn-helix transcriptional regulator [Enterococcus]|uniref:helix-turn-helix transcriptional regulator n=1 Tax=Enterococcus TaxID=1350 RepID=UPI0011060475|nr:MULTISPECIES: helix-turn-helix domain-containing protein [Enterococcus]MDB1680302.1 helix-turn-helix domain-containing protein [Enterococcus durans]
MTEMTILLSEEQLTAISNQLHATILTQIEQIKDQTLQQYRYMNKKQTCSYLQVSNNTLDNWIKEGLPIIQIHGSNRFDRIAIDQWLANLAK